MTDQSLARAFAALGDPTRRAVFEQVAARPQAVRQLADQLPVSRPAVSQHLKVLADAGLVVSRAHGTSRIYELDPRGLEGLRDYLEGFWQRSLRSFSQHAEARHRGAHTAQEDR
jgi:DNA-binding transcriptional ArsR family regulator